MNEAEILDLISGIQDIIAEQNKAIQQLVNDNLDLKKRVEKLEGKE